MRISTLVVLIVLFNGSAQAMTCTERLQVCHNFCIKSMSNSPGCHAKCREIHQECMASGCWESKITARQCNIDRK
jgi:hypothetical protein